MPRFLMPKEIELRNTFGKRIERGSDITRGPRD